MSLGSMTRHRPVSLAIVYSEELTTFDNSDADTRNSDRYPNFDDGFY